MENVTRTARRFVRKELKGNVSFETLSGYAAQLGYVILFYSPDKMNGILIQYNLLEYAESNPAFVLRKNSMKYIFINAAYPEDSKMLFLAHELAHIVLKHLDTNKNMVNEDLQEVEADAFAYTILNYRKPPHKLYALIGILSVLLIVSVSYAVYLKSTGLNAPVII